MGAVRIEARIVEEGSRGPALSKSFDADEGISVRDISSRLIISIPAKELSVYRHTLFIDGRSYRLLTVLKQDKATHSTDRRNS